MDNNKQRAPQEQQILQSWQQNAPSWIKAVREGRIASRTQVTNQAILSASLRGSPRTAIDLGCGEGWLCRALAAEGLKVIGVDAIEELIAAARSSGGADYHQLSFEDIASGRLPVQVDVAVCNFSLFGDAEVARLFRSIPALLAPGGRFVVQTLHPVASCGDLPYEDGWRPGSWEGCGLDFINPAPWYFRTLESWRDLFTRSGMALLQEQEPSAPDTLRPASIIFIAEPER